jgi:hypothetical protein
MPGLTDVFANRKELVDEEVRPVGSEPIEEPCAAHEFNGTRAISQMAPNGGNGSVCQVIRRNHKYALHKPGLASIKHASIQQTLFNLLKYAQRGRAAADFSR